MDTLYLTNSSQKINKESRSKLYFDEYEFCIKIFLQDVCGLRSGSHELLDDFLKRQSWARCIRYDETRWKWINWQKPITATSTANCHKLLDELQKIDSKYKSKITYHNAHFYTNQLCDFDDVLESPGVKIENIKRAVLDLPPNEMYFKKTPKHRLRTYFKNQRLDLSERDKFFNFIKNYDNIRISPGIHEWIVKYPHSTMVADNYFIDYNDKHFLTMLHLVCNIKIKETYKLLTR